MVTRVLLDADVDVRPVGPETLVDRGQDPRPGALERPDAENSGPVLEARGDVGLGRLEPGRMASAWRRASRPASVR